MSNEIFNIVVSELEDHLGDILAKGITKKALEKVGSSEDEVDEVDMKKAIEVHIKPTLPAFMFPENASECLRVIEKRIVACC